MKIEVTCGNCQSVLRVDGQHAGKQLRCPTCGSLCNIPYPHDAFAAGDQYEFEPQVKHPLERGQPDPDYEPPIYIGPQTAPLNPDQPYYQPTPSPGYPQPVSGQRDEYLGRSYLVFALGVGSVFACGCIALIIAPAMFVKGMEFARTSTDPNANVAFFLNAAGMFVWAVVLLILVAGFIFH
jgi:hypothetical protein